MKLWHAGVILAVLLLLVVVVGDRVLSARLKAQQNAFAAEHLHLSDFALDLPEAENAATFYKRAGSMLSAENAEWEDLASRYMEPSRPPDDDDADMQRPQPLSADEEAVLAAFVEKTPVIFSTIEQGLNCRACQFGDYRQRFNTLGSSVATDELQHLSTLRNIARLVAFRAVWESRHGSLEAAFHWAGAGLHLANGLENDPLLVTGMVGAVLYELSLLGLHVVLEENELTGPIPSEFMTELDIATDRLRLVRYFEGESCFADEVYANSVRTLNPLTKMDWIALLKDRRELLDVMRERDDAAFATRLAEYVGEAGGASWKAPHRTMTNMMHTALSGHIGGLLRSVARARTAKAAIALKQWKASHGLYPATLEELGPLPVDPATAKPFLYRQEGEGCLVKAQGLNYGVSPIVKWRLSK